MNVQICYLQVCIYSFFCINDGLCIVMNVLQLFRLNIACVKLFLCLAVLVVGIADQKATVQRESGMGVWGPKLLSKPFSSLWRCKNLGGWAGGHTYSSQQS